MSKAVMQVSEKAEFVLLFFFFLNRRWGEKLIMNNNHFIPLIICWQHVIGSFDASNLGLFIPLSQVMR